MVKKTVLIIFFALSMILTGCNSDKNSYSYHPTYIESNNGKRWLNYAILYENAYNGVSDGTLSVLKQSEYSPEYQLFFTIDSEYYRKGDIILGTSKYIYIFNQDDSNSFRIVGYNLLKEKISPIIVDNKMIKGIVNIYGANNEYIYLSYFDKEKEIYIKMKSDLSKYSEIESFENINDELEYTVLRK